MLLNQTELKNTKWNNSLLYQRPINLLFSMDQFLPEFSKKYTPRKKSSDFQKQLKERKKLSLFYGNISKRQVLNIINKTKSYWGYFVPNFLLSLEKRLDVILYRTGIAKSIPLARQLITHKKIYVNNTIISSSNYVMNPADVISIKSDISFKLASDLLQQIQYKKSRPRPDFVVDSFLQIPSLFTGAKNQQQYQTKHLFYYIIDILLHKTNCRAYSKIDPRFSIFFDKKKPGSRKEKIFLKIKPIASLQTQSYSSSQLQYSSKLFPSLGKNNSIFSQNEKKSTISSLFSLVNKKGDIQYSKNSQIQKPKNGTRYENDYAAFFLLDKKNTFKFLIFHLVLYLQAQEIFNKKGILKLQKYLNKKRSQNTLLKALKCIGTKPLNVEICYKQLNIVFLYAPQRIYFPFYIDIDLIVRSLR